MELHINYETIKPFPLTRIDLPTPDNSPTPKPKLKADKTKDKIFIDTITTLEKIPKIAWEYRLGNRSALEWVLDEFDILPTLLSRDSAGFLNITVRGFLFQCTRLR